MEENQLKILLTWYKRRSHNLTTTSYVICDSVPRVGKKSQKSSTSHRKGGRVQAFNIVPHPSPDKQVPQPSTVLTPSPVLPQPLVATLPSLIASPPFAIVLLPSQVLPSCAAPPPVVTHPSSPFQMSTAFGRVPYPFPRPGQFIVYPLNLYPN